jgi:hypothetical protein
VERRSQGKVASYGCGRHNVRNVDRSCSKQRRRCMPLIDQYTIELELGPLDAFIFSWWTQEHTIQGLHT